MRNAIIIIGTNRYIILALRLINNIFTHYKGKNYLDIHVFSDQNIFQVFDTKNVQNISVIYHEWHQTDWWSSSFSKLDAINYFDYKKYSHIACLDADSNVKQDFTENDIFLSLFAMEHISEDTVKINSVQHFEELPKSSAYLSSKKRIRYYQADYFGGTTENFLKMVSDATLKQKIDKDNNIFPKWADEAYLQPFLNKNNALCFYRKSKSFPFIEGDKGLGDGWNAGPYTDLYKMWPDDVFNAMISAASELTLKNKKWDIVNNLIV
jgi:hypothetical protein